MVFGIANPFSWIFNVVSSEKCCSTVPGFVKTVRFFPPAECRLVNLKHWGQYFVELQEIPAVPLANSGKNSASSKIWFFDNIDVWIYEKGVKELNSRPKGDGKRIKRKVSPFFFLPFITVLSPQYFFALLQALEAAIRSSEIKLKYGWLEANSLTPFS